MRGDAPPPIRLVLADDHKMFVEAIELLLAGHGTVEVVAKSQDGDTLLADIARHRPDIALVDLSMPGPGAHAIAKQAGATCKLIALTMHLERALAERLLDQGFHGYVVKDAAFDELLAAVDAVMRGERYVSKALDQGRPGLTVAPGPLTPREMQCLRLAAEGQSNKQIARAFSISERTVKFHFENILEKLGAANRLEAVAIARRALLI